LPQTELHRGNLQGTRFGKGEPLKDRKGPGGIPSRSVKREERRGNKRAKNVAPR